MLFRKGPCDTAKWAWYHFYERYREWSLGIETASSHEWANSFDDCNYHDYEPLCYACLDGALSSLNIEAGKEVFLDYGSGKGRIVTVAATYPFQRVIGVEMLPELNTIANQNIRRAQRKLKCKDVETIATDATTYSVPRDVTVIFLFNPFLGQVLRAVQQQILKSLDDNPRKLTVVYMNPSAETDLFADCGWLEQTREIPTGRWDKVRFVVYESKEKVGSASDRTLAKIAAFDH